MGKIAILGAMTEEIEPILACVENINKISYANNTFYEATYMGKEVVIAYSKIGKVFSALTASLLVEKFGCDVLLFSGVAGGVNKELKIGDLIIASGLCQHDLDITAFGHPHGYVPEGEVCIATDENLRKIAKEIAKEKNIALSEGIIATGDQFVHDASQKKWICDTFQADALEMEGGSVAVVCNALNVPVFILRAISDTADGSADVDFDKFLATSAKVSADFILQMVERV